MSLPENNNIRRRQEVKSTTCLKWKVDHIEEYEIEGICDTTVHTKKSEGHHLQRFNYIVLWKGFSKKENTWKPMSTVQHLQNVINTFLNNYSEKPIVMSPSIDTVLGITRPRINRLAPNRKCSQLIKANNKHQKSLFSARPLFYSRLPKLFELCSPFTFA